MRARAAASDDDLAVCLFGNPSDDCGGVGAQVAAEMRRLSIQPTSEAWDFLAFALSVTAADVFIPRRGAADGWTRQLRVVTELANPADWQSLAPDLEWLLGFLSGDIWRFEFRRGGLTVPAVHRAQEPSERLACLFSGGLDSYVGAIDLVAQGRLPLLISQAYRVEQSAQTTLAGKLGKLPPHLRHIQIDAGPSHPDVRGNDRESSMRTRSLLFVSLGALAASAMVRSPNESVPNLIVPENGFIALNPPLTPRRVGSLSTRTTHPAFLHKLNTLLPRLGVHCELSNPYDEMTKGEMLDECLKRVVVERCGHETVSCGKSGRRNQQCGRCVPCLIRRAAFRSAKIADKTNYEFLDLNTQRSYDDVLAFRTAIVRARDGTAREWLRASAPFPDSARLPAYARVIDRGLAEVEALLADELAR